MCDNVLQVPTVSSAMVLVELMSPTVAFNALVEMETVGTQSRVHVYVDVQRYLISLPQNLNSSTKYMT